MTRHPVIFLLILVLLLLGAAFLWAGHKALKSRHFESAWQQDSVIQLGPIGVGAQHESGVDTFDGADAVRIGLGWMLFGGMFVFWGVLALWAMIRPKRWEIPRRLAAGMAAISLLLLAGSLLCLLPPWRLGTGLGPVMWITMLLVAAIILCLSKDWLPKKWIKYILPGLIVMTLAALLLTGGRWPWGIILALFAGMALAGHGAMLYLWTRKEPKVPFISGLPGAGVPAQASGPACTSQ